MIEGIRMQSLCEEYQDSGGDKGFTGHAVSDPDHSQPPNHG